MKTSEAELIQEIAAGAWTRLRNLIGALDRVDRLETSSEFAGWLQSLATDESSLHETILEFMLRALRIALDRGNWRILTYLDENGGVATSALLEATSLPRVELVERMSELARAGLTVQALDGDQVEATAFAQGLLSLVGGLTTQVQTLASNDYLIKPQAQPPRPEPRVHIFKPR